MNRRGFTLAELLIALWGVVLLAAAAHTVLRFTAREARAATAFAHASRQQFTAWALIRHDLDHAWTGDLTIPSSDALEYSRPIGEATVCEVAGSTLILRRSGWLGDRLPDPARDLALVLSTDSAPHWLKRGIVSVAVANCPDLSAALSVVLDAPVPNPAVLRAVQPVRLRSYPSGDSRWLGLEPRLGPGTIQPILGPLGSGAFGAALTGQHLELSLELTPTLRLLERLPLGGTP